MPSFDNLSDLFKHIESKIEESLEDEVAKAVKKEMQESLEIEVYSSIPNRYDRRYNDGGLADPDNIVSKVDEGVLSVFNIAKSNESWLTGETSDDFVRWIEEGRVPMIWKHRPYPLLPARPFIQTTREMLESSGMVESTLKKGLKKRGLKVE